LEDMVDGLFSFFQSKRVFLTGDTGFKGSWLALWLHELGASVYGFALPPTAPIDNYCICGIGKKITHTDGDIRNYNGLYESLAACKPDIVFHLAAQALVLDSYKDPCTTFATNIMGTAHLLEAIRHVPSIKSVVIITTDKCYENREWFHAYRECDPLGGIDPYSASKAAAEIISSSFERSFFSKDSQPAVATARAGNVIGGGDWAANRIIPDFIRTIEKGEPIIIRHPESVRPWQHVLEPLYGYLLLANRLYNTGKEFTGAWNFGPLQKGFIKVKDLIAIMIKTAGKGSWTVEQNDSSEHEAGLLALDITKAINLLGWVPVLSLEQTIQWVLEEYTVGNTNQAEIMKQRVDHIRQYMDLVSCSGKACANEIY
jgi:CDP-glucose 4,6-dehydratase